MCSLREMGNQHTSFLKTSLIQQGNSFFNSEIAIDLRFLNKGIENKEDTKFF